MRKYTVITLCLVIIIGVTLVVANKSKAEKDDSHYLLTEYQKKAIKQAKIANEDLSDKDIDSFTIGQGKYLLDQYFKKHDINYQVGTKKYIHFLADIGENRDFDNYPEFTIIDAYAAVYLSEYQKKDPILFRYHLEQSTLEKTIKEVREENNI